MSVDSRFRSTDSKSETYGIFKNTVRSGSVSIDSRFMSVDLRFETADFMFKSYRF
jgi:hypothetical protein